MKIYSSPVTFDVVESDNPGFVQVSPDNPRYFSFTDGTPFFPIGQNLAFIAPTQYLTLQKTEQVMQKMKENNANFARIWACSEDWAMAIEARKSAWGRSWDWNPPFVSAPSRDAYHKDELAILIESGKTVSPSPTYPLALRPNTAYILRGEFLTSKNSRLTVKGEPFELKKKGQWQSFSYSFTTSANQWWWEPLTFQAQGEGTYGLSTYLYGKRKAVQSCFMN